MAYVNVITYNDYSIMLRKGNCKIPAFSWSGTILTLSRLWKVKDVCCYP